MPGAFLSINPLPVPSGTRPGRRVPKHLRPVRHLVAVALGGSLVAAPVHAASPQMPLEAQGGVELGRIRTTPKLSLASAVATDVRTLREGDVGAAGPFSFFGGHIDTSIVVSDRWIFPLLGGGAFAAVGPSARTITSLDGSFIELRPWTAFRIDLLLPGIGVRFKERRWAFAATVRAAYTSIGMNAAIAAGASWKMTEVSGGAPSLRMSVEACRRVDPTNRACLFITPNLYEVSFLNGGSVGLQWEYGP